jgi:hypothetical protein
MSARWHARMGKLERPISHGPRVCWIEAPSDMDRDAALAMLKYQPRPFTPLFYLGLLKPGEKPRYGDGPSPISDAEWETLKDYPKRKVEPEAPDDTGP